jgi:hypothetical protein
VPARVHANSARLSVSGTRIPPNIDMGRTTIRIHPSPDSALTCGIPIPHDATGSVPRCASPFRRTVRSRENPVGAHFRGWQSDPRRTIPRARLVELATLKFPDSWLATSRRLGCHRGSHRGRGAPPELGLLTTRPPSSSVRGSVRFFRAAGEVVPSHAARGERRRVRAISRVMVYSCIRSSTGRAG